MTPATPADKFTAIMLGQGGPPGETLPALAQELKRRGRVDVWQIWAEDMPAAWWPWALGTVHAARRADTVGSDGGAA